MPTRITFRVVHWTSEEPTNRAIELQSQESNRVAWVTAREATFPQEVVLQLERIARVQTIQILSHEAFISSRLILHADDGTGTPDFQTADFTLLGHVTLDPNSQSKYQARELKTVYLDVVCRFIRIRLHQPYANPINTHGQVGIVAINIQGEPLLAEDSRDPRVSHGVGAVVSPLHATPPFNPYVGDYMGAHVPGMAAASGYEVGMTDTHVMQQLRDLQLAKQEAVIVEDYDRAKGLKAAIDRLTLTSFGAYGKQIMALENQKRLAVQNEDYDTAKLLKTRIDELRAVAMAERGGRPGYPSPSFGEGAYEAWPRYPRGAPPFMVPAAPYRMGGLVPSDMMAQPPEGLYHRVQGGSPQQGVPETVTHTTNPQGTPTSSDRNRQSLDDRPIRPSVGSAVTVPDAPPQPPAAGIDDDRPIRPAKEFQSNAASSEGAGASQPPSQTEANSVSKRMLQSHPDKPAEDENSGAEKVPDNDDDGDQAGPSILEDDRPIRPAATTHFEESENLNETQPADDDAVPSEPEPIPKIKQKEAQPFIDLFGEREARCVYSRHWVLREQAMKDIGEKIKDEQTSQDRSLVFRVSSSLLKIALADKLPQVYMAALNVLTILMGTVACHLKRAEVHAYVEPLASLLVNKLGDPNVRVRERTQVVASSLAAHETVGAGLLCSTVVSGPPKKKASPWRQVMGRLNFLQELISTYKLTPPSELALSAVMKFVVQQFHHSNADVRSAAVKVTAECWKQEGHKIERYLEGLKVQQKEMLSAEIGEPIGDTTAPMVDEPPVPPVKAPSPRQKLQPKAKAKAVVPKERPKRTTSAYSADFETAREEEFKVHQMSHVNLLSAEVQPLRHVEEESAPLASHSRPTTAGGDYQISDYTCPFCGAMDKSFTDENLDLHFFKDCPMLVQCSCEQVIEIATLTEHLLTECEYKASFIRCPKCQEPVHVENYLSHTEANTCLAAKPPSEANRCPLCHQDILPEENGWKIHLVTGDGCPENERTQARSSRAISRPPTSVITALESNTPSLVTSKITPRTTGAGTGRTTLSSKHRQAHQLGVEKVKGTPRPKKMG